MAEASETPIEDVEFLRTKLRELKTQARQDLEELRKDRDKMREYKTIRDEHNKEVRALIESVKAEREQRDKINQDITEAKDRRTAIHTQLKSVYDEIRDLRGSLVGSPSTDQRRMMRRVEELEWRQQTEQLSRDEELEIVDEIAHIEAKLVKIGQEKEKQDRISELRRLARRLKDEATDAHQKVLELSEQSQVHHQEVVRIRPQLEQYKKSADTAHQNFVEWLKRVKEGETKLKDMRTQIDDIQGKIRKHVTARESVTRTERRAVQKAHEQEKVDAAMEKLQSGKRLTFDEFILAQRVVSDDKKRGGRRSSEQEEEVSPADFEEEESEGRDSDIGEEGSEARETEFEEEESEARDSDIENADRAEEEGDLEPESDDSRGERESHVGSDEEPSDSDDDVTEEQ